MDLSFETGEEPAELFHGENESDDRRLWAAEALPRHGHRDSRRVGDEHDGGDTARHFAKADPLGVAANEFLVGLIGCEDGIKVFVAGRVYEAGQIDVDHCLVHLFGKLFEREIAIAGGETQD